MKTVAKLSAGAAAKTSIL